MVGGFCGLGINVEGLRIHCRGLGFQMVGGSRVRVYLGVQRLNQGLYHGSGSGDR